MRSYRILAAAIIMCVTFFFIGRSLYNNWSRVPFEEIRFHIGFLAISYLFQFIFFILGAAGWVLVLRRLGVQLPFRRAIEITSASKLARYIPGKVWALLGQVYLARRDAVPARKGLVSVLLSTILSMLAALLMFLVSLIFFTHENLPAHVYLALLLIPLSFLLLHPAILSRTLNWSLRVLKRDTMALDFSYVDMLKPLSVYCLNWVAQGFCFFFLIRSFYPIPISAYLPLMGINALAWTIGFLSFIVPGGLGVREGIQSFFLKFLLPLPVGIIAALLYRIWAVIGMLVFFAIFARGLRTVMPGKSPDQKKEVPQEVDFRNP